MKYKIILECIIYENFDVDLDVMKQIYFAFFFSSNVVAALQAFVSF